MRASTKQTDLKSNTVIVSGRPLSAVTRLASIVFFPITLVVFFRSRSLSEYGMDGEDPLFGTTRAKNLKKDALARLNDLSDIVPIEASRRLAAGLSTSVETNDGLTNHVTNLRGSETAHVIRIIEGLEL